MAEVKHLNFRLSGPGHTVRERLQVRSGMIGSQIRRKRMGARVQRSPPPLTVLCSELVNYFAQRLHVPLGAQMRARVAPDQRNSHRCPRKSEMSCQASAKERHRSSTKDLKSWALALDLTDLQRDDHSIFQLVGLHFLQTQHVRSRAWRDRVGGGGWGSAVVTIPYNGIIMMQHRSNTAC